VGFVTRWCFGKVLLVAWNMFASLLGHQDSITVARCQCSRKTSRVRNRLLIVDGCRERRKREGKSLMLRQRDEAPPRPLVIWERQLGNLVASEERT
jgi:hypothetical protein